MVVKLVPFLGNDEELFQLLKNVTIPGAGVIPYIPKELLKKGRITAGNGGGRETKSIEF